MKKSVIFLLAILLFVGGTAIYKSVNFNEYNQETLVYSSSNLFDKYNYVNLNGYQLTETGFIRPAGVSNYLRYELPTEAGKTYTLSFNRTNSGRIRIIDKTTGTTIRSNTTATIITFVAISDITRIEFETSSSGIDTTTEWSYVRLNEGSEIKAYEPFRQVYQNVVDTDNYMIDYLKDSNEMGDIMITSFKGVINILDEALSFIKDSIPSKDNVLGPLGAIIKRIKEAFPGFFMPNPIAK